MDSVWLSNGLLAFRLQGRSRHGARMALGGVDTAWCCWMVEARLTCSVGFKLEVT